MAAPKDSIGTKVRNGKVFIIHEVDKGTGVFTVAKRYGISIDAVVKENPGADKGLLVGQLLYIPTGNQAPFEEPVVKEYFKNDNKKSDIKTTESVPEEKSTFATFHIVQPGETLFGIAKKYQTSVAVIKDLNSLPGEELSPGLKLVVPAISGEQEEVKGEIKEPVSEPVKENPTLANEPKEEVKEKRHKEKKKEAPVADKSEEILVEPKEIPSKAPESSLYSKKVENLPEFDVEKISEAGLAKVMNSAVTQTRNVCMHHEAPENTIIMVTNPINKKAVFVKVTGKFDFNSGNATVILLSKNAMDQIGLNADGGAVEISYAR
jgi:LysM repeat protein